MKCKVLFFLLLAGFGMSAQSSRLDPCAGPPPPLGMNPIYAFDDNNDGIAVFDIPYYIENILRPNLEQIHGVSTSGYDFVFYGSDGAIIPAPQYTNIEPNEIREIQFEYNGTGPTLNPLPPCFWPVFYFDTVQLNPVATDGDLDNDGILNSDEDANNNGNLMDDDEDNDGLANVADSEFSLGISETTHNELKIYPNPVNNGQVYVESGIGFSSAVIYDSIGRKISTVKIIDNTINLQNLVKGVYLIKFELNDTSITRKIIIE